jgi:hypothetical protein
MKTLILAADDMRRMALRVGLDTLMDEAIASLTAAFQSFDPARHDRSGPRRASSTPGRRWGCWSGCRA